MNPCDITVIVPTRNEAKNIGPFLGSIPASITVIVVDTSTDDTVDIIRRLRPRNTHVMQSRSTIPEARQLGAEAARTEWLLFTDADVVFPETYFSRLQAHLDYDCVYGGKLSRDRFATYYQTFSYGQKISHRLGIPAASGSNLAVRRRVLFAVGGFDPQLVCNEDSELVWRIARAGFRIQFAADAPVYAQDHRRLERGRLRKTAHTLGRCLLLYSDLAPSRWRNSDWGYWSEARQEDEGGG